MNNADKYVYPGTNILINKYGCRDAEKLQQIEILSTAGNLAYLQLHPIEGSFDFQHLKDIHHFIFQDLFEWAGQVRTVDIGKNNLFCRVQHINSYASTVFSDFYSSCYGSKSEKESFIKTRMDMSHTFFDIFSDLLRQLVIFIEVRLIGLAFFINFRARSLNFS